MPWYYAEGTPLGPASRGPLDDADFAALASSGQILATTLVWQRGMAEWQPLAIARPDLLATPAVPDAPPAIGFCALCGLPRSPEDLLQFGQRSICPACKPRFATGLTLGVDLSQPRQRYAGFWIRFGARVIDGILIGIVQYSIVFAISGLGRDTAVSGLATILAYLLIQPTYEAAMTVKQQATLGKLALGLRVVRTDGSTLTWGRAIGRYFAQLLSSVILLIGYIMAAFDDRKQALHDRLCDTVVIYEN
ncbi:MAG: RDD family protein [Bryobacteraceae bacterium]|nr:RDD family protein [Bryobacteraceae bacterium]